MKGTVLGVLITLTLTLAVIPSCKKSFTIEGEWKMTENNLNGIPEDTTYKITLRLKTSGEFSQTISSALAGIEEKSGEWEFKQNEQLLILTYSNNSQPIKWKVTHLSNDSLKINTKMVGFFVERTFRKVSTE